MGASIIKKQELSLQPKIYNILDDFVDPDMSPCWGDWVTYQHMYAAPLLHQKVFFFNPLKPLVCCLMLSERPPICDLFCDWRRSLGGLPLT